MMSYKLKFSILALLLLAISIVINGAEIIENEKISESLIHSIHSKTLVNVLVSIKGETKSVLEHINSRVYTNRAERATNVYNSLKSHATVSQKNVLTLLKTSIARFATKIESLWITNQISIKGADKSLIQILASMVEVSKIVEEEIVQLNNPIETSPSKKVENSRKVEVEWGIEKIQAPAAWNYSTGTGVVVGIIDTGARYTHQTIRESYSGGNYSWYNPLSNTRDPIDDNGHGTHVTGTIVGSHGIGVAPDAKWISCKPFGLAGATETDLLKCFQFMACPHHWDGSNPDCSFAPHVVSNSWGAHSGTTTYDAGILAWHAADIIPVFAAGNGGVCRSIDSPGDSKAGVITVGATIYDDSVGGFSSLGPSDWEEQKPNICAPGESIRSGGHLSDYAYSYQSGTSMATPHVTGLIALMKSKNPSANYTIIKKVLEDTAERGLIFSGKNCSGVPDNVFPNYHSGFGRIDALRAVLAI